MTDTLTTAKSLVKQTIGGNDNTWGTSLNSTLDLIDKALGQTLSKGITTDVTLSSTEAQNAGITFTGTLSANAAITWPTFYGPLRIKNGTTGGYSITCGMATGATVKIGAGNTAFVWSDGAAFIQIGAGAFLNVATFGATGNGSTDDTTAAQAAITAAAVLGGTVYFPAGTYIVSTLTIPTGGTVFLKGDGFGSCLKLKASTNADMIVSANAYTYLGRKITASITDADNSVVLNDVTGISTDDALLLMLDGGGGAPQAFTFYAGVLSGSTVPMRSSPGGPSTYHITTGATATAGNPCFNANTPGPTAFFVEDLFLDGNKANQNKTSRNIATSQSGSATLSLVGGGTVTFGPFANEIVFIYSSGNDSAKTFTITGTVLNNHGVAVAQSDIVTGASAAIAVSLKQFHTITSIVASAIPAANVEVGSLDTLTSSNGITYYGAFPRFRNVLIQAFRGWGLRTAFQPGGGFTSTYQNAQGIFENLDIYTCGGGWWSNGPNDSRAFTIDIGYAVAESFYFDRYASATKLYSSHCSGGNTGTSLDEQVVGYRIDADSAEFYGCTSEEARDANALIRANNVTWLGGVLFHGNDTTGRVGFQIGDANWQGVSHYRIDTRVNETARAAVYFSSDGGYGDIRIDGYFSNCAKTTVTGAANNGSGLIRLTVSSTSAYVTGLVVTVASVTGTTEANGTWTITVIDSTHVDLQSSTFANAYVSGGYLLWAYGYSGTPATGASGSRVFLNMQNASAFGALSQNPLAVKDAAWTPAMKINGVTTGITGTQTGTYSYDPITKRVHIEGSIILTSKGAQTGNITITTPVTQDAGTAAVNVAYFQNMTTSTGLMGYVQSSTINLGVLSATGFTTVTNTNATNTTQILFSADYLASA